MEVFIVQGCEIEYNDDNYSIYSSISVLHVGLDFSTAIGIIKATANNQARGWRASEVEGASTEKDVYRMLVDACTMTRLPIVGADSISELDECKNEKVVWVVAEEVYDKNMFTKPLAAFRDPRDAANFMQQQKQVHEVLEEEPTRAVPLAVEIP